MDQDEIDDHRARRRRPDAHRPAPRPVAVGHPDDRDRRRERHRLDERENVVGQRLRREMQRLPLPERYSGDLDDVDQAAADRPEHHREGVHERHRHPHREQTGRDDVAHREIGGMEFGMVGEPVAIGGDRGVRLRIEHDEIDGVLVDMLNASRLDR